MFEFITILMPFNSSCNNLWNSTFVELKSFEIFPRQPSSSLLVSCLGYSEISGIFLWHSRLETKLTTNTMISWVKTYLFISRIFLTLIDNLLIKYWPLLFSSNDMTATQFNFRVPVNLVKQLGNKIIWYLVQLSEYLITYHRACPDIFQEPLINPWRISGLLWIPTTFKKENQVIIAMHCQALQAI